MATNARNPPQPSTNGVITAPPKALQGNRKKQKRRAKQAARNLSEEAPPPVAAPEHTAEVDYDEDPLRYDDEEYDEEYSDAEPQHYDDRYAPPQSASNGYAMPPPSKNRKKNKKKRTSHHYSTDLLSSAMPSLPTPPPPSQHTSAAALRTMHKSVANHPNIWNTSTQQERQNIKDFWLSLSEDERKSLLKIEKEAVLRKMKQQQKHSCSCTVCGRKRTAIEEELEVLYEGYYEELEQYAHHDPLPTDGMLPEPLQHRPRLPHPLAAPPPNPRHRSSQMLEHLDEEEEISEDEEYSDEEEDEDEEDEEDDEEDYSDEEPDPPRGPVPDFFNFGQNLTVKGILTPWLEKLQSGLKGKTDNLLTVADDLLKNDGRKFIEMMEQLAERRMQRESEAEYAAANPSHPNTYPPNDPAYNHEDPLAAGDEYDDEEASYDSNEEYDDDLEEEDEMGGLTEEQRMQEGRRMFQIFAARMFEQRVLTAYKERVAKERQEQLLNEEEEEKRQTELREAKKKRDAEKRKEKKRLQNLQKAEEKAQKEAEKAAEEARLKAIEEKKQEEARRKREEQRKKKEEERRKQEEEKARKEAEKQRRQLQEQQRREDAERKAREQRAAEKAKKEEARKREREERELREKEAKERKAQEEKARKERDAKTKADRETKERERAARQLSQSHPPQIAKRPSQAGMVAVPGVHPKQTPSGFASPHTAVATPAVPKAPTPAKQKQASQNGSHASSPMQPQSQASSAPSKSSSPGSSVSQQQSANGARSFMQKGPPQQGSHPPHQMNSSLHQQVQPPPGMPHMQHHQGAFGGMPPLGFQAFQGPQSPMMHNMPQRGPVPMYGHQGPPMGMGMPSRMSPFGPPGMNGMNGMNGPPGMMHPHGRGMGFPFDQPGVGAPPGFGPQIPQQSTQTSPLGQPMSNGVPGTDVHRPSISGHSRQQSSDKDRFGVGAGQPIARPAPIQRPGSMQSPVGEGSVSPRGEAEAPSKHLGSSALLDDSDEPIPQNENRRMSHNVLPTSTRSQSLGIGGLFPSPGGFGTPATSWATPALPLGQSPGLGQQQWGSLPNASHMTGWANNNNAFASNGAFGPMGVGAQLPMQMHRPSGLGGQSRPLTIRLAICQACKQLAATNPTPDGFYDLNAILRQMPALNPPPSHNELEAICETEGDSQNGGGELSARKSASGGEVVAVKWTPDSGTPKDQGRGSHAGLGEIGSPMPSRTSPAGIGFDRPGGFPNLGAVGSPGY